MGYRIRPDGVVEADTLEEAVAFQKAAAAKSNGQGLPLELEPEEVQPDTDYSDKWTRFCDLLEGDYRKNQRAVLQLIRGLGPKGIISTGEICRAMKVRSNPVVGGFISGITKNVGKAELPPGSVVARQLDGRYRAGPLLLRYDPPAP